MKYIKNFLSTPCKKKKIVNVNITCVQNKEQQLHRNSLKAVRHNLM